MYYIVMFLLHFLDWIGLDTAGAGGGGGRRLQVFHHELN